MVTHFGEESTVKYDRRCSREDGVDPAQRAKSSDAIVDTSRLCLPPVYPILDLARLEHALATKAASTRASGEQVPIARRKPVY